MKRMDLRMVPTEDVEHRKKIGEIKILRPLEYLR